MSAQPARTTTFDTSTNSTDVESVILDAVRSIRFGSIEVVIHNARVVQVERREKLRFASPNA